MNLRWPSIAIVAAAIVIGRGSMHAASSHTVTFRYFPDSVRLGLYGSLVSTMALVLAGGYWAWRRVEGKALSVLRLAKASFTFAGGADYIAWKINRHAGTSIELKPWQRRHPLLAGLSLLPQLLKGGAIK